MIKIVTLDVGLSTGYASGQGKKGLRVPLPEINRLGVINHSDIKTVLPAWIEADQPDVILIEFPLLTTRYTPDYKALSDVIMNIQLLLPHYLETKPGYWKPTPVSQLEVKGAQSPHERDAGRMLYWFFLYCS